MDQPILLLIPLLMPIGFVAIWLLVTGLIGAMSGWYGLAARYPDSGEEPLVKLKGRTGLMNGARLSNVLDLSACPSGLRLATSRVFMPFAGPILVPWNDIAVSRGRSWFGETATLRLGQPAMAILALAAKTADRLAYAAKGRWPEPLDEIAGLKGLDGAEPRS